MAILVAQVRLIANKYNRRQIFRVLLTHRPIVGRSALQKVVSPDVDALITLAICQVKYDHAAVGTAIKRVRQALEPLLSSRVPDLYWYYLAVLSFYLLLDEVRADRWLLRYARFPVLK